MNCFKNIFITDDLKFGNVFIQENEKQNCVHYADIIFTGSSETSEEIATSSVVTTNKKLYVNSFCKCFR
jgi:type I restriction enzyme S subunit